jgi:inorganic triphosphatase YgiF
MVTFLQDTYHLEPQLSSKFERGLHFAGIGVTNTPGSKATIGIRRMIP